eukprot:scaffold55937_cov64-Cyclotella_meneghiniana.AAC.2
MAKLEGRMRPRPDGIRESVKRSPQKPGCCRRESNVHHKSQATKQKSPSSRVLWRHGPTTKGRRGNNQPRKPCEGRGLAALGTPKISPSPATSQCNCHPPSLINLNETPPRNPKKQHNAIASQQSTEDSTREMPHGKRVPNIRQRRSRRRRTTGGKTTINRRFDSPENRELTAFTVTIRRAGGARTGSGTGIEGRIYWQTKCQTSTNTETKQKHRDLPGTAGDRPGEAR